MVDVRGIDKAELLAALYNRAKPQGMGFLHFDPADMIREQAHRLLDTGTGYFDYVQGRVMKVQVLADDLDPRLYDRDNGQGAVASVVERLRATAAI